MDCEERPEAEGCDQGDQATSEVTDADCDVDDGGVDDGDVGVGVEFDGVCTAGIGGGGLVVGVGVLDSPASTIAVCVGWGFAVGVMLSSNKFACDACASRVGNSSGKAVPTSPSRAHKDPLAARLIRKAKSLRRSSACCAPSSPSLDFWTITEAQASKNSRSNPVAGFAKRRFPIVQDTQRLLVHSMLRLRTFGLRNREY